MSHFVSQDYKSKKKEFINIKQKEKKVFYHIRAGVFLFLLIDDDEWRFFDRKGRENIQQTYDIWMKEANWLFIGTIENLTNQN